MRSRTKLWFPGVVVLLAAGVMPVVRAAEDPDPNKSPALCGSDDTREPGIQGDVPPEGGVNCGLTLLSELTGTSGAVQGAGHCAYVRTGGFIKAYDLSDPANPRFTEQEALHGNSESFRTRVTADRAILVSGRGVWDITNCEDLVFKGEIDWPSLNARAGATVAATSQHEIAISHDGKKVYTGLGFAIAYLDDLNDPTTWQVYNHTCEGGRQAGYPLHAGPHGAPTLCDVAPFGDYPPQLSHSSDDNVEGTRWYGANQKGGASQIEPPTLRVWDISTRGEPLMLGALAEFPGHSMDWWRLTGREFVVGANEGLTGTGDPCQDHPRPTSLNNALDAYVADVTGDVLKHASRVSLMINEPQNCGEWGGSRSTAAITGHSIYNMHGAAMLMMEFGSAGLRVFDIRDGYAPKEVAYFNRGDGHVHSGRFHYDDARGLMLQPANDGMRVLELQPRVIKALGLPKPTDPAYPRYRHGRTATP